MCDDIVQYCDMSRNRGKNIEMCIYLRQISCVSLVVFKLATKIELNITRLHIFHRTATVMFTTAMSHFRFVLWKQI